MVKPVRVSLFQKKEFMSYCQKKCTLLEKIGAVFAQLAWEAAAGIWSLIFHAEKFLPKFVLRAGAFKYAAKAAKKAGISTEAWVWLKLLNFAAPYVKRHIWRIVESSQRLDGGAFWHLYHSKVDFHKEILTKGGMKAFVTTPKEGAESPLHLFYLHGGDFVMDIMPYYGWMLSDLAERLSCTVHMPSLSLAPKHTWRETMDEILEGYQLLVKKHGAENIVVMGDSAGGWLSVTLGREIVRNGLPKPRCLVLYSPFLDLSCTGEGQQALAKVDPLLDISFLRQGGQMWVGERSLDDPEINPMMADSLDYLPPTIVFTGTRDILNSDARRLKEKAPWIVLEQYHGMLHIFMVGDGLPESYRVLRQSCEFIENPYYAQTALERQTLYENSRQRRWRMTLSEADPVKNGGEIPFPRVFKA